MSIFSFSFVSLFLFFITAPAHSLAHPLPLNEKPTIVIQTASGKVDMCLACHFEELDKAHARGVVACSACHLGNALSGDKVDAHKNMVKNPGELSIAHKTCGQTGCHQREVGWVKNSLMTTNTGIINALRFYWGETHDRHEKLTVEILKKEKLDSPALSYFRKLCGSCHLGMEKGKLPAFLAEKGGGCSACHLKVVASDASEGKLHPLIVRAAPMENCVRCHNRSGRIGLSYQGIYESEGYGTPYDTGDFSADTLSDGRFVRRLAPDIHQKAGLVCVDCHTQLEVMGDGALHSHLREQLEVRCEHCHSDKDMPAQILRVYEKEGENLYPKKENKSALPRLSLEKSGNEVMLKAKSTEKLHKLKALANECKNPQHSRLSCQACHSTWVPQCYGCHVRYDAQKKQLDKVTGEETNGRWQEFKDIMRYETPPLGMVKIAKKTEKVVVMVPGCQDFVSFIGQGGAVEKSFVRFTASHMDPHTTQQKGRSCKDCHQKSEALGLGTGNLTKKDEKWFFQPALACKDNLQGDQAQPLDSFVDLQGKRLMHSSTDALRPFDKLEIERILQVGLCLDCHKDFSDPVMSGWKRENQPLPCGHFLKQH